MTIGYYLNRIMRAGTERELDRIAADFQRLPAYTYSTPERQIIIGTLRAKADAI